LSKLTHSPSCRIYQLEKDVHDAVAAAAAMDAEARPLVGGEDPEVIFKRALVPELRKITSFYTAKEAELNEEVEKLLADVSEFDLDAESADGRRYSVHSHISDGVDDSDEDDETVGLTRGALSRRKSVGSITGLMTASAEFGRALRRRSTTLSDEFAERSLAYSTGIVLKKRITALYVQLCELKSYIQLNKTGFSKILKKFDKILQKELRARYMDEIVLPAYPFRPETRRALEDRISQMETAYATIATQGDLEVAKEDLRSHLREHVVWERNTVWRDMIGLERRAEAARLGRAILGTEQAAGLQGDDVKLPVTKDVRTPFGRIQLPVWLANSAMFTLIIVFLVFFAVLTMPIMERPEQQNCLALLVFVSSLWATEVCDFLFPGMTVRLEEYFE